MTSLQAGTLANDPPNFQRLPPINNVPKRSKKLQSPLTIDSISSISSSSLLPWRGQGGRHATVSGVEFDRQLDKISLWFEEWDHETRCSVLESLLRRSKLSQLQFMWTVSQPTLHRDFMYTAKKQYPDTAFTPVSTFYSREIKPIRLHVNSRRRSNNNRTQQSCRSDHYHRIASAYLQLDVNQTKEQDHDVSTRLELPQVLNGVGQKTAMTVVSNPSRTSRQQRIRKTLSSQSLSEIAGHQSLISLVKKQRQMYQSMNSLDQWLGDGTGTTWDVLGNGYAALKFVDMPVKRHIQNDSGCHGNNLNNYQEFHANVFNTQNEDTPRSQMDMLSSCYNTPRTQIDQLSNGVIVGCLPLEGYTLIHWYSDCWTDVKRNEFLHKLFLKLDPRQQYFLSAFLAVRKYRDFISLLPESLSLQILDRLSPVELLTASQVCKQWKVRTNGNELWKAKCQEVKLRVPISDNPVWKTVFRDNLYLRLNWSNGICRTVDLKGHTHNVLTAVFDKTRLASGSLDRTIKIWDIQSGDLLQTLEGHTRGVWCLKFFTKNLLLSGSYDTSIRVWNLQKSTTERTLLGHTGPVWALALSGTLLVSASQDRTAMVWNIRHCQRLHTLTGHCGAVFAVDVDSNGTLILTASADKTVRLWSPETGQCKRTFWVSCTTSVMSVSYSAGHFACSYGETVCLYSMTTGKLIRIYKEHTKRVESVELRLAESDILEGMIVSAGKDGLVKYWDVNEVDSIQTFEGHTEPVNCIRVNELRIVSASYDHKIRIWDFNV